MTRSTEPDRMVVLRSANGLSCAKQFSRREDGRIAMKTYDNEYAWHPHTVAVDDFESLGAVLAELTTRTDCIVIPGALVDDQASEDQAIARRMRGDNATIRRCDRSWLALDLDSVPVSGATIEEQVAGAWKTVLPLAFREVACWYQLTSQAGMGGPGAPLRARFWYLLDEPVPLEVLRQWTKAQDALDPSVCVATQPIYVASPTFIECEDPVAGRRLGRLAGPGTPDRVRVADMGLAEAAQAAERIAQAGRVVSRKEVEPCEEQIHARIAQISEQVSHDARHFHALGAVCELYALGCDPERMAETAEDIIRRQGRSPRAGEVQGLLQHAARRDAEGQLTSRHRPLNDVLPDLPAGCGAIDEAGDSITQSQLKDLAGAQGLSSKNPDGLNAQLYLEAAHPHGGLLRWAQEDWEWTGKAYRRLENSEILKARIDRMGGVALSDSKARACASKVRGMCSRERLSLPGWISKGKAGSHAVIVNNGILFVGDVLLSPRDALLPHDIDYFSTNALPFDYDPDATCPTWEKCVDDWFLDDYASKRELQKIFGYLLVPDNQYEKFFVLTDPVGRAGKGTAVQVLCWLLGPDAVAGSSFSGLANRFGLESLIGKTVALFNEANAQKQHDVPLVAVDRIKMLTGNDTMDVERKHVSTMHHLFRTRLVMSCNRLPNFSDPSGALMKRMHVLRFRQTFDGREDTGLKREGGPLHRELPGILNWAIEGLRMLYHEDKRFIRPQSTAEVYDEMERVSAPVRAFVRDCLVSKPTTDGYVPRDDIFRVYVAWARQSEGLRFLHSKSQLFKELRPLVPSVLEQRTKDPHTGRSAYVWWGLSLSETAQELGSAGPVFGA